jgi:hypothetical protein
MVIVPVMIYMRAMSTATSTAIVPAADNAIYMAPSGELQLDVRIDSETVWLTQAQMASLFGSSQRMMSHHINNVFLDGELERRNNIQKMYIDRSKKLFALHSLGVIISRVRLLVFAQSIRAHPASLLGTDFRATSASASS